MVVEEEKKKRDHSGHVVVDVKLVENRNCEKSSEKAMTKLKRLHSSKEGTAVNAATL